MGLLSAISVMPLGIMFLVSGVLVNFFQLCAMILLLPFSERLFRLVSMRLFELVSAQTVWLLEWWAGVEVRIYADAAVWGKFGKEHALIICNHRSDVDWLVGWVFASRSGCLDGCRAIMKKTIQWIPVIGWGMWLTEYIFLDRQWDKDANVLKIGFQRWRDFPRTLWIALFVEGTRFTPAKLKSSQEFAASKGLPPPRHVLVPRTKGFVSAVENLRSFVPAVYDVTFTVSKTARPPTLKRLLNRQPSVVHMHVRRVPMEELPATGDEIADWCMQAFIRKDELLEKHESLNTFGEELYVPITRSVKPLLIVIGWCCGLLWVAVKYLAPFLSTRTGVLFFVGLLVAVSVVMQIAVLSTQSERSTPAKIMSSKKVVPVAATAADELAGNGKHD